MVDITQERLLAGARNLKAKGYTPQQVDAWLQTKGSSLDAMKQFVKTQNTPMQKMTFEQREQARQKWRDEHLSAGDKVAEFMATNPGARQAGLVMQGVANADLNPAGYVARGLGMDTRPIEAQNGAERAAELIGKYGFDTAAIATGLSGLASAGVGGTGLTGNVIKTMAEGGVPAALATSTGSALATGYINPQSEWGRALTDLGGGFATAPIMSAAKSLGMNALTPKGKMAKAQLNSLTNDPEKSIIGNYIDKFLGKGKTINDVLKEESNRLARQADKADKVKSARMANQENSQPSYDIQGVLGRNGRSSLDKEELGAIRRLTPNETISQVLDNPIEFNEYASNMKNAKRFHKALSDFKQSAGAKGEQVWLYTPEEYAKMRTFLSDDGKVGFAIKDDGDIVSVFSNKGPKGAGDSIMQAAVSAGGKKLDAFDTFLPEIYSKHGFKETGRFAWDPEIAKNDLPNWDKTEFRKFNLGEPDVVMMQYDPNYYGDYVAPNSLENVVSRLQNIVNKSKVGNFYKSNEPESKSINLSKFIDSLRDVNKVKRLKNAGKSGADDIVNYADRLARRIELMEPSNDTELRYMLDTPATRQAKQTYSDFINQYGDDTVPTDVLNNYYEQNPLAQPILAEARAYNPTDFKDVTPNSLRELDKLKQVLHRAKKSNDVVGKPKEGGYKNAESALKNLMEDYYSGFKDVNKQYAKAMGEQDIVDRITESNVKKLAGTAENEFFSGLTNPLTSAGITGGLFDPKYLYLTLSTLSGKSLWRNHLQNIGRELVYDNPQKALRQKALNARLQQIISNATSRITAEDIAEYLQNR